ncbi:GGDEF domain-containing response regulator [Inhella gelatinilytica]|uniref:diguanylate cyclase n=1 Tax=Inhella gelatinilytica TaxID=2795030 RepID=A0A931NCN4_9BURK|nr:diguanylate cyclase [Inhella gelatinilytica]MBH9551435.1 diguanylate cyclase [Inhella gelatinilytica]
MKEVVVCVDDDSTVLRALRSLLMARLEPGSRIEIAESGDEALELLQELDDEGLPCSVLVSDFIMPGMRGDELLVRVHRRWPEVLTVMLTGQSDLEGVKRSINEAALYRFIEKPFDNDDMVMTLQRARAAFRQARELAARTAELERLNQELEAIVAERTQQLEAANRELAALSRTDALTGLANRRCLDEALEHAWRRAGRAEQSLAAILLDIDHFKQVNDQHGHGVGDSVLVEVAGLLRRGVRATDLAGRWGGEEFLILCPDTDRDGALALAEKLRAAVEAHAFEVVGRKTSSFGVATLNPNEALADLLRRTDEALYRSKREGRNRVTQGD